MAVFLFYMMVRSSSDLYSIYVEETVLYGVGDGLISKWKTFKTKYFKQINMVLGLGIFNWIINHHALHHKLNK